MKLQLKPHFTAKIGQFFIPMSQKVRLCVDVILMPFIFICRVAYQYVYLNPYGEGYTNVY